MNVYKKKQVLSMYINTDLDPYDIADRLHVKRREVIRLLEQTTSLPPDNNELACINCTPGFIDYLRGQGHGV
jgi:hypothetical protein